MIVGKASMSTAQTTKLKITSIKKIEFIPQSRKKE
jgi:hypothetical protein